VPRDSSPRGTTLWPWQPRDVTRSWRPACLHFVAQSVAEEVAIPHRYATFCPNVLNDPDAQSWNALFGGPINTHRGVDRPATGGGLREFMFTDHPWLAADPILGRWQEPAVRAVAQTAAWILRTNAHYYRRRERGGASLVPLLIARVLRGERVARMGAFGADDLRDPVNRQAR
jgi:hypothetical protein